MHISWDDGTSYWKNIKIKSAIISNTDVVYLHVKRIDKNELKWGILI
jgi:hypothetical protein